MKFMDTYLHRGAFLLLLLFQSLNIYSQSFSEPPGTTLTGLKNGSAAWGDYDNDGDLDLLITGENISSQKLSQVYKCNSDKTFTLQSDITLAGVQAGKGEWGDYDNDGDLDILISGNYGSTTICKLYKNKGSNNFEEQSGIVFPGIAYGATEFGDYDNDGNIDILIIGYSLNYGSVAKVFRNNGDNSFTEVSSVSLTAISYGSGSWGDYDNDGDLDLLISGLAGVQTTKIYKNNGDNTFTEQTGILLQGVTYGTSEWGDYDNDGDLDILLAGIGASSTRYAKIYRNEGNNSFSEVTGLSLPGVQNGSASWGDFNNDGFADILINGFAAPAITKIFQNNGNNTFSERTDITLTGIEGTSAWGDYDNDGDLDIVISGLAGSTPVSKIYRNEASVPNLAPAQPTNLNHAINNNVVTCTWNKSSDNETASDGLNYNIYVYEDGKSTFETALHSFRQSDVKNGLRLVASSGPVRWSAAGYKIKDLPCTKQYYWTVQAIDPGLKGGGFSSENSFTMPFYIPVNQASSVVFSNIEATQVSVSWAIGGGSKRVVFLKAANTGSADPVDNITYNLNDLTPGGWKCVYNGTGNSASLSGLNPNTDYLIHVCEYNGDLSGEKYLNSTSYLNPAPLNTVFSLQTTITNLTAVSSSSANWGNFDNDGDLDLIITGNSVSTGRISKIYSKNNGVNSFTEMSAFGITPVSSGSTAWGDFNNDGYLDLLISGEAGSGKISKIFKNDAGTGFSEQTGINIIPLGSSSASWGDYDNDGDLDLLITGLSVSNSRTTKLYRNNGDNTFTEQTRSILTGVASGSVSWGDCDNDGDLDVLIAGIADEGIVTEIYVNKGDNLFIKSDVSQLPGISNGSAVWGDYNNDGLSDILLTGTGQNSSRISKVFRNDGNFAFSELTSLSMESLSVSSGAWCDYDIDGDLDIFITGENSLAKCLFKIYRNDGNNSFTEIRGTNLEGVRQGSIALADYDSDGDQDLLLTGTTYLSNLNAITRIYRNEIPVLNNKPAPLTGLQSEWKNDSLILRWNKSTDDHTPQSALKYNLRIGTSTGGNELRSAQALPDGKLLLPINTCSNNAASMVFKVPFNKYYWSVQAIDNGSAGSDFAAEQTTPLDSIQAHDLEAVIYAETKLKIKWENGNGLRRALFGRISATLGMPAPFHKKVYMADAEFGSGDQIGSTGWYCLYNGKADSAIVSGINQGYSYDFAVVEYIENAGEAFYFRTSGNANPGTFSSSLFSKQTGIILPGLTDSYQAWGDFDNDGFLDILTMGSSGSSRITKVFRNMGNNTFEDQTGIVLPGLSGGNASWSDYDNDGDLDILIKGFPVATSTAVTKIYRNNGDKTFTEETRGTPVLGLGRGNVSWGDYDKDGDMDFFQTGYLTTNVSSGQSQLYRNNNDGTFNSIGLDFTDVSFSASSFGDYDNDGDLDIVLAGTDVNSVKIAEIYRNMGINSFVKQTGIALTGVTSAGTDWGDCDNDGDLDLMLAGLSESGLVFKLYINNGDNTFSEQQGLSIPGISNTSIAWGDYNRDGYPDILLTGSTTGSSRIAKVFRNNKDNTFSELTGIYLTVEINVSASWGDYDNDGDLDILMGSSVYSNNTFMKAGNYVPNKKPSAPTGIVSEVKPEGILLSWNPVTSDETSSNSMSYNIRVGTTTDQANLMPPHSDLTTGFRRIVSTGNVQTGTTHLLKKLPAGTYYWRVQAVDQAYAGGNWSSEGTFEVKTIQAFFSTDEVCIGFPTHFTDQSVSTIHINAWKWDFGDGNTSSDQNPSYTFSTSGTHNVKLVVTNISGAKDSLVQAVYVKSKPFASFDAPAVCQGTPAAITNTTDTNGLNISSWFWDFGDGQTSIVEQPAAHGYLGAAEYTVVLKALADNGCIDTIARKVVIGAYPIAAVTANAPLDFCKGDSVILSVPYNSLYTYNWKIDGTALTGSDSSRFVAKRTGNLTAEVVNPNGNCKTTSSAVSIIARDAPSQPAISLSGPPEFCQGDSVILSVTNTDGYSYQWRLNEGAIGINSNKYSAKASGSYDLVVSNSSGCKATAIIPVNVNVKPLPAANSISLTGSRKFCSGQSSILSVPNNSAYSFRWKNGTGYLNLTTNSITVNESGNYTVDISLDGCTVTPEPQGIEVVTRPSKPDIDTGIYYKRMCLEDTPPRLSVDNIVPGYSYQWYKNETPLSTNTFIDVFEAGNYYLEAVSDICSSARDTAEILFAPAPPKPDIFAVGPPVWMLSTTSKTSLYKWYFNGTALPDANKNIYLANQNYGLYRLAVANETGCYSFSDTLRIPLRLTGIEDTNPFEDVKIYPNPTTGLFTIEMNNNVFGELIIDIFAQNGSKVLNIKFEKSTEHFRSQIDMNGQSRGLYLINLSIEKYSATRKLLLK